MKRKNRNFMCNSARETYGRVSLELSLINVDEVYGLDSYRYKEYTFVTVLYMVVDILDFSLCLGCYKHNWAIGKV